MALNDTYELAVRGTVLGQQHIHTLHFRSNTALGTAADLAADWENNLGNTYRAIFRNNNSPTQEVKVSHVCGTVPLLAPGIVTPAVVIGSRANPGSEQDDAVGWLASMTRERTAIAGRKYAGRFFLGGLLDFDMDGNNLETGVGTHAALVTAYINALDVRYIDAGMPGNGWALVVHSRSLASQLPPLDCDESSTLVTALQLTIPVSSQRSRRPGSGL